MSAAGSAVAAENLGAGAYVISADVALENTAPTMVTLTGGGEAVGFVEPGAPITLSLSVTRNLGGASNTTLVCAASGTATAKYANVIATQVKSQSRVAGCRPPLRGFPPKRSLPAILVGASRLGPGFSFVTSAFGHGTC